MVKSNKQNNKQRARRTPTKQPGMPSQINMHPIHMRVFRFNNGAQVATYSITRRCMLSLQAMVTVASTTSITIIQAIRLRRVSVWALSANGIQSVSIEWTDPHGPATQKVASGTTTIPAHLVSRPPTGSFADLWSQVTASSTYNEILFQIQLQEYSMVDVECELVYSDGLLSNVECISRNLAAGQVGLGYSYLDNSSVAGAAGTNQIAPASDYTIVYTT
jgi:hypothetical protein